MADSCQADESSDESSATLSDEESSQQHIDAGRDQRREHRDIALWTPGGDRDPWEFRSGALDKKTELTTASKLLYGMFYLLVNFTLQTLINSR